jgi:hypothetical protein
MKVFKMSILAALLGLGMTQVGTANAEPILNYNYADVRYSWTSIDQAGVDDANGVTADLSFSPIDNFFLEGGYEYADSAFGGPGLDLDADAQLFNYGGGFYFPLTEEVHAKVRVGGLHARIDSDLGDASDNGVYAGGSLRIRMGCAFELEPAFVYNHVEATVWDYTLSALVPVADNVGLVAGVGMDDDKDVNLNVGVRFTM